MPKIEIDFREAKQYFGLRDFKNIKEQQVTNAIQIAITSRLVVQIRAEQLAQISGGKKCSTLDVKAYYRAKYYAQSIYKLIPNMPEQFLSHDNILKIAQKKPLILPEQHNAFK